MDLSGGRDERSLSRLGGRLDVLSSGSGLSGGGGVLVGGALPGDVSLLLALVARLGLLDGSRDGSGRGRAVAGEVAVSVASA